METALATITTRQICEAFFAAEYESQCLHEGHPDEPAAYRRYLDAKQALIHRIARQEGWSATELVYEGCVFTVSNHDDGVKRLEVSWPGSRFTPEELDRHLGI